MTPKEIQNKRVLISPLNWGFGHVSRCIGLIHQLKKQGNEVLVACDEVQEGIFKCYFPELVYLRHDGYPFKFGGKGHFGRDLISRFSSLYKRLKEETKQTEKYVREQNIDIVLSDHRYGFLSKKAHSIFITHQYNLPLKWYEGVAGGRHRKLTSKFNEIWIMDYNDSRLAGKLSMSLPDHRISYIGPYSRFSLYDSLPDKDLNNVLIASGPKIYAQQLVDDVLNQYNDVIVICAESIITRQDVVRISGSWKEQDEIILRAQKILSRSGYSTIMDIDELKVNAIYFPTPGQAEQEYLFELHNK